MTDYTYNTGNPIGSTDVRDGVDNLKSFDVLLNSTDDTYQDRLGNTVPTAAGAIKRLGPVVVGWTFTTGGTLNYPNEAALNPGDGNYYGWTGSFPHVAAPGTDPAAVGSGYVPRADVVLRAIAAKYTTVSGLASEVFSVGDVVVITDRGMAIAEIKSTGVADGELIHSAGAGKFAHVDRSYWDKVETYSSLQAAVTNCSYQSIRRLIINSDITSADISKKGNVAFVGEGSVSCVYRKRVAKFTDPVSASFSDINPETHLKRFLSKTNPVVVVVGDSISTEYGANVPFIDCLYNRIVSKVSDSFPDKTITFYNRAIAGETYFTAVGLPSSFPSWYTNQTRGWPLYVGDLNPDLVIFNFGMNDSSNLHTNKLKEYQALFDNVSTFPGGRPDVIYCSNLTPALDTTYADLGSEANQSGRDHVGGYTRNFAKAIGAGLFDFHRQCTIVKDGYDPTDTYLERIGAITPVNGAVSADGYPCTDFKWNFTLSLSSGSSFAVRLGCPSDAAIDPVGRGSYVVIYNDAGFLKADFFEADAVSDASIYASKVTTVAIPSGSFTMTVEKRQNTCLISINNNTALAFNELRVSGKDATPKAGDAAYSSGPFTAASFWAGRYKTYQQSIVNDRMWGTSDNQVLERQPYGGNGVNHPSSVGCAAVFQPVLDNANLSGIYPMSGNLTLMNGWRAVPGKMPSRCHRIGKFVNIQFSVRVPTDGVAAKGIVLNVPDGFRPPSGVSVYAIVQSNNATVTVVQADLSSNGDIQLYHNVDQFAWGSISFVLS